MGARVGPPEVAAFELPRAGPSSRLAAPRPGLQPLLLMAAFYDSSPNLPPPTPTPPPATRQVEAFEAHWGARISVLPGVTHDLMLGGQALRVAVELLAWLETLPPAQDAGGAPAAAGAQEPGEQGPDGAGSLGGGGGGVEAEVRVLPLRHGLTEPGAGMGAAARAPMPAARPAGRVAAL